MAPSTPVSTEPIPGGKSRLPKGLCLEARTGGRYLASQGGKKARHPAFMSITSLQRYPAALRQDGGKAAVLLLARQSLLAAIGLILLAVPALAEPPLRLMAFGDSLTHGYGLAAGDTFPEQLQAALEAEGRPVEVLNAGNSGDTTASGLARLDWALGDNPDAMLIALGANDGLRGIDPQATLANLDAILAKLQKRGLPVLLVGMLAPRNLGREYVEAFDTVFPDLAEKYEVLLYPFFLEGVALEPDLNQPDGIHPNRDGVAVMVQGILPSVRQLLDGMAQTGKAQADG